MKRSLVILFCVFAVQSTAQSQGDSAMRQHLENRVAREPQNATALRLLGQWQIRHGEFDAGVESLLSAVQLDPESAAIQAALAQACFDASELEAATDYARRTIELAPQSEYADEAQQLLSRIRTLSNSDPAEIVQAGYEMTRFDNSAAVPDAEELLPQEVPDPWRFRVESGLVYNSNVTLTPINRELFPGKSDTGQLFFAPEFEYRALDTDAWGAGPSFLGHFTLNEDEFQNLNLQSWQPGAFLERVFVHSPNVHVARLQYGFTLDAFDGNTIGNRHSLMASAATVWECQDLTFAYVSTDHTDLKQDGVTPSVTGRDGWTYRVGAAHTFACDHRFLKSFKVGIDGEYADLTGSDFRYGGVSIYSSAEIPLTETLMFEVEGGWGYRDYFDFDESSAPSRNENIWRTGCRLTKKVHLYWSVAGVVNYDRFASDNALFDADRILTGVVLIFER